PGPRAAAWQRAQLCLKRAPPFSASPCVPAAALNAVRRAALAANAGARDFMESVTSTGRRPKGRPRGYEIGDSISQIFQEWTPVFRIHPRISDTPISAPGA